MILINKKNEKNIDNIYIHDSIFYNIVYNYVEKKVFMECKNSFLKKIFLFEFTNVIHLSVCGGEPWGEGNYILNWKLLEIGKDIDFYKNIIKRNDKTNDDNNIYDFDFDNFIYSLFTLNSGDRIIVVCENITIREKSLG